MKKSLRILILLVIFSGNSCQQPLDVEKEKEALIDVNEEERDAYFARDLGRLETIWQQEPASKRVFATTNSYIVLDGWQEIRANYEEDFNNDEKWNDMTDVTVSFSNNENR